MCTATMTTLEDAIRQKYLYEEGDDCMEACVIFAPRRSDGLLPATIVINNCTIAKLGNFHRIRELCCGIRELDLAQNEILDVQVVLTLLEGTTRLSFLNLSCNNLCGLHQLPSDLTCYSTLKKLVLNSTHISWDLIQEFLQKLPNLEELYLCLNGYKEVTLNDNQKFTSVKLVHLSGNPINSWEEVVKVGKIFPKLNTLVMVDCDVSSYSSDDGFRSCFENLEMLNMNNNKIRCWEEIDKLHHFPSLKDVRVLGLPCYEEYTEHERRQLLICRLPNIQRLNGSTVSENEREDAERAFIRHYMKMEVKPARYWELEAKHGKLDPLVEVDLAPQLVATVTIQCGEHKMMQSLNLKQTVAEFKSGLQEFTGLLATRMRVFYFDKDLTGAIGPEEMKFNAKKLYSYCVQDGDEFIIDEKL